MENAVKKTPTRRRSSKITQALEDMAQKSLEMEQDAPKAPATSRPPMRDEDPRSRAAKRAAEIRKTLKNMDDADDKFWIEPHMIPDGWVYEWKTKMILGKEDPVYFQRLLARGWSPVERNRHPEMMPFDSKSNTIEREGQILMERPREINDEAIYMWKQKNRQVIRDKEAQLYGAPDGTFQRNRPSLKKGFDFAIPEGDSKPTD